MSVEQALLIELIGIIKWIAVGGALIALAVFLLNRNMEKLIEKKSDELSRTVVQAAVSFGDESKKFVDYLIAELEKPRKGQ